MKLYISLFLILCVLESCYGQSCECKIQYVYFNNDSVLISSSNYNSEILFNKAFDSLENKYPQSNPRDSVKDVYIGESYGLNVAQNNKMSQLEGEGYTCICAK